MAGNSLGLGKGLDALIRETGNVRETNAVHVLPLEAIIPNPNQPRRRFSEKALEELAASIASQGLLQPILVRPMGEGAARKYEIIAGERRWRASKLAGLKEVPVVVRNFTVQETLAAALIENLQREDLNPVEEALGIQVLKDEFGLSQEDVARKLGKSRSAVANSLRLLTLPESFHKDIAEERLSAGHARALLSITEERAQGALRKLILEEELSVREAEGLAASWKETGAFRPEGALARAAAPDEEGGAGDGGTAASLGDGDAGTAGGKIKEAPSATAGGQARARQEKPQSARLMEIQNHLHAMLSMPVRVTGKDTKGRISLTYTSREQLESLMNMLALAAGESSTRVALSGAERAALQSSAAPALEGADAPELKYFEAPALQGSTAPALDHARNAVLSGQDAKALAEAALSAPPDADDNRADSTGESAASDTEAL